MAKINLGKVGMRPRDDWSASVADYEYLDTVRYAGEGYMVKNKVGAVPVGTLPTNTNYFMRLVDKGDKGDRPSHEWDGTKLKIQNPDGSMDAGVDLKGQTGDAGAMTIYTRDQFNQLARPLNAADLRITSAAALIPRFVKNEGKGFAFQGDELVYPYYAGKESMVLHYDFSGMKNTDVTKGIAMDLSGNGNNGVLSGFGYVAGSGYQDGGLELDGVDDYAISDNAIDTREKGFTYEAVVDLNLLNTNVNSVIGDRITGSGTGGSAGGCTIAIQASSNSIRVFGSLSDGSPLTIVKTDPIISWGKIHISVNYESSQGVFKIFINGGSMSEYNHPNFNNPQPRRVTIGRWTTGSTLYPLWGAIYVARVYNRPLTPTEIQTNYLIDKQRFNLP